MRYSTRSSTLSSPDAIWTRRCRASSELGEYVDWRLAAMGDEIWSWLSAGESGSAVIRNLGVVVLAVIALPLAVWRGVVADRQAKAARQQADTAEQGLLYDRYQKGAEMLGSAILSVRLGGIYALEHLGKEYSDQFYIQVMRILCAYVRHPTRDSIETTGGEDKEHADVFSLSSI